MMERPSMPAEGPGSVAAAGSGASPDSADLARRAQFLATEHWSLLATRSMSWNEAFSRTAMFLSTLSAATVALALAGPAMAFGDGFELFALVVLAVTLFLGVATYVRLIQVNNEDILWTVGMNRLRAAYVQMEPGIEEHFTAGWTLDARGVSRTFGASDVTKASPLHAFVTTPAIVAVIASVLAGIIAGLVAVEAGAQVVVAIGAGLVVMVVACAAMLSYGMREYTRFMARLVRDYGPATKAEATDRVASR